MWGGIGWGLPDCQWSRWKRILGRNILLLLENLQVFRKKSEVAAKRGMLRYVMLCLCRA